MLKGIDEVPFRFPPPIRPLTAVSFSASSRTFTWLALAACSLGFIMRLDAQLVAKLQSMNLTGGELSPAFQTGRVDYSLEVGRKTTSATLSIVPNPAFTGEIIIGLNGVGLAGFSYNNVQSVAIPLTTDETEILIRLGQSLLDTRDYHISVRRPLMAASAFTANYVASPELVRFLPSMVTLPDDRVLVAGGINGSSSTVADAEIYDPATNQWTRGPLNFGSYLGNLERLADGRILRAGGMRYLPDGTREWNDSRIYDPVSGLVQATNALEPRAGSASVLLDDGRVLVAGGYYIPPGEAGVGRNPEIFNPVTGTWSPTGLPEKPIAFCTLTKLADGRVLAAGIGDTGGNPTLFSSIYDPATGAWTTTAPMGILRQGHAATLLADGRVLVSAGNLGPPGDSEIYNPATGVWSPRIPLKGMYPFSPNTGSLCNPAQFRLSNGNVVLIGKAGSPSNNNDPHMQIFDVSTETWSGLPSTNFFPTNAALLSGDRILIHGVTGAQMVEFAKVPLRIQEGSTELAARSLLNLGTTPLGVPRTKTLTMTNTGTTPIRLKIDDVEQAVAGEFTTAGGTATLAAGASTTVTVTFTPATNGTRTATFYVWTKTGDDVPVVFPIELEGRVGALSPYDAWAATVGFTGAHSGPGDIFRNDGVKNLLKFAFNTVTDRPDVSVMAAGGTGGLPRVTTVAGTPPKIRFEYVRRKDGAATYTPQYGTTLGDFIPTTASPVVTSIDATWERVVIEQNTTGGKAFGRVKVDVH